MPHVTNARRDCLPPTCKGTKPWHTVASYSNPLTILTKQLTPTVDMLSSVVPSVGDCRRSGRFISFLSDEKIIAANACNQSSILPLNTPSTLTRGFCSIASPIRR